jgi:hypothetical protein
MGGVSTGQLSPLKPGGLREDGSPDRFDPSCGTLSGHSGSAAMGRVFRANRFVVFGLIAAPLLLGADKPKAKAPPAEKQFELSNKWVVLVNPAARIRGQRPLPEKGLVQNFGELKFTGPRPGHPFVLGDFIDDGDFALIDGILQPARGTNCVVQFPEADEFELEGIMEHIDFGGWFMAFGWGDGRGYVLSNVTMRESGSPWFLTELRGGSAIPDGTEDLEVGRRAVIDHLSISNYEKGRVLLGVYDTRYGPKKLKVHSLRMRALTQPEEDKKK